MCLPAPLASLHTETKASWPATPGNCLPMGPLTCQSAAAALHSTAPAHKGCASTRTSGNVAEKHACLILVYERLRCCTSCMDDNAQGHAANLTPDPKPAPHLDGGAADLVQLPQRVLRCGRQPARAVHLPNPRIPSLDLFLMCCQHTRFCHVAWGLGRRFDQSYESKEMRTGSLRVITCASPARAQWH